MALALPKKGGTLVVALSSEPVTLDISDTDSGDTIRVGQSMFETLVEFGDQFGMVDKSRGLAEDWTISDDGLTIVGYGSNPNGSREAWIATIPEPASVALLSLGGVALLRRRR